MDILTSLYTLQIVSNIPYSSVSVSTNGVLSCSIQCQEQCLAFTYNKQTSTCELVSEFYTGTPPVSPTEFYIKNLNCPVLNRYKYITSGATRACVKFNLNQVNWPTALYHCQTEGDNLVQLTTTEKTNMITQYLAQKPSLGDQWWIGFKDRDENDVYRWMNNDILNNIDPRWFNNGMANGEPSFSSFGADDDCGVLRAGKFCDYNCVNPNLKFICEKDL